MLVSDVRRRTRATADVIESKLRNTGVELQQERERLANATSGAEDSDLGGLKMKMDMVSTLAKLQGTEPSDERMGLHTWLAEAEKARFWRRLKDWRAANILSVILRRKLIYEKENQAGRERMR